MRKLILFFSFALFFACGRSIDSVETNSGNILENLTYSVDTVVVDPGDDLLNLKDLSEFGKRNYFSVSQNSNYLYFFDRHSLLLNEINLNSLELAKIYPFEEEGPDGIGRFVYTFKSLPNGNFYERDVFGAAWFFSKTGKKIKKFEFNEEVLLKDFPFGLNLANQLQVDLDRKKLYSLPIYINVNEVLFAVMDSLGQKGKILELPLFRKIDNYKIGFNSGGEGGETRGEQRFLQLLNDQVLISSTFGNAIYIYNPELDSLWFQEFPHELTPLEKDVKVKNEVHSRMEFQVESDKLHTQIDYWDFYWDEQTQRYYRFASIGLPLANVDSPKKYEYFMFAYDRDLTLKGETKLENLENIPRAGFFKNGKLWSYVNVEDELGFAVFTFNF